MTDSQIRRRSLAKGAAWAAPIAVASMAAPAYAASSPSSAFVCLIASGAGTASAQETIVHFNFSANSGSKVKKGTIYRYTVTATAPSGSTAPADPVLIDGATIKLTRDKDVVSGSTRTFELTIEVLDDIIPQCGTAGIKWQNSDSPIAPNSTVTLTSSTGGGEHHRPKAFIQCREPSGIVCEQYHKP